MEILPVIISLFISPETIRKSEGSKTIQVFSEIYFQLNTNVFFPMKSWDDFTVIILTCWIRNTISCFYSGSSVCYFMHGPYKFSIESNGETFHIVFFDNDKVICSINISKKEFLNILKKSTNLVIRNLIQKNIITKETEELQESFDNLQKLVQSDKL